MKRWIERISTPHLLFFTIAFGFTGGIFIHSFFDVGYTEAGFLLLLATGLFVVSGKKDTRAVVAIISIFLLAGAFGIARFEISEAKLSAARGALLGYENQNVTIVGDIVKEPDKRASRTLLTIEEISSTARVLVYAPPRTRVSYGDIVEVSGVLKEPENFSSGNNREFDYKGYLKKDNIVYTLSTNEVDITERGRGNPIISTLLSIKSVFLHGADRVFPEPDAGLLGGIIWGEKHGLSESLSTSFRNSGLIHVIVLSGYNMTIVAVFMMWLFGKFTPRVRFSLGILSILLFAIAAGGGATVFRAAVMAIIAFLAKASGRPHAVSVSLTFAALLMLIWNPRVLVYDPSFQLSFLATIGLVYISPLIERWMTILPKTFGIREVSAATIGTQIAVLPLLLYMMGTFSLVSVPANILALPFIPIIMFVGTTASLIGFISYPISLPFVFVAHVLIHTVIGIAHFFGTLPLAAIPVPQFSPLVLVVVYMALFVSVVHYQTKRYTIIEHASV